MMFGTQERETQRYKSLVSQSERDGKIFALKFSFGMALIEPVFTLLYALGFWSVGFLRVRPRIVHGAARAHVAPCEAPPVVLLAV